MHSNPFCLTRRALEQLHVLGVRYWRCLLCEDALVHLASCDMQCALLVYHTVERRWHPCRPCNCAQQGRKNDQMRCNGTYAGQVAHLAVMTAAKTLVRKSRQNVKGSPLYVRQLWNADRRHNPSCNAHTNAPDCIPHWKIMSLCEYRAQ
jgi:hypothetical protein